MSVWPDNYPPLNGCGVCGLDFTSVAAFDAHRVGQHEYDWSLDRPDGRRCLAAEELDAAGLRPLTEAEMVGSVKYRGRVRFGVPLVTDPEAAEAVREAFRRRAA